MGWLAAFGFAIVVGFVAARYLRESDPIPREDQLGVETLEATLEEAGVDHGSTKIPNVDLLQPHISQRDDFLGAIAARRGTKHTILVALGDRLVAAEATLGSMGAEVLTVDWAEVEELEQTYDIGGELRFETHGEEYEYTHLPRSQTPEFTEIVEERVEDRPDARS